MSEKTSPATPARARPARKPAAAPAPDTADKAAAPAPEGDRIAKVLSRAGVASRREAERLIEAGEVKVNGKLVTSPALNVTARDRITVSGHLVAAPEPARLWLYHKPLGLVTSNADEKGRDTVFDHLPEDLPRVMTVGRLDLNSEGLLLLTNDGELKRRLELPSTGWLRKYRVRVKGNPTDPDLAPLRKGMTIEGERFQPMEVVLDRHQGSNAWLTIGLREGKNREIRRAMTEIGLTVNRLIRVSYGPFRLNELKAGEVEEVRPRILREQLGALLPDAPEDTAPGKGTAPKSVSSPKGKPRSQSGGGKATRERDPDRAPGRTADAAPGRVTSPRGKAGLKTLSNAWSEATTPKTGPKGAARPKATRTATSETGTKTGPKTGAKTGSPSGAKTGPRPTRGGRPTKG